jgi:lipoprotein NlpD
VRSIRDEPGALTGQESASAWYTVQKGDTLFRISTAFRCTVQDLARWNGITETAPLATGQRLRVRAPVAVVTGAQTRALSAPAVVAEPAEGVPAEVHAVPLGPAGNVETRALDTVPTGATAAPNAVPAPAIPGNAPLPAPAATTTRPPTVAAQAVAPTSSGAGEQPAVSLAPPSSPSVAEKPATSVPWIWPVDGRVAGTFDAVRTKGIEIAAGDGAKIVAVADGEVSYTGAPRDYGNLVIVRHPDGLLSVYAHTKAILVVQGQTVKRGQAIATAGKTDGGAQNVHFEVRRKGVPIDPLELLPAR